MKSKRRSYAKLVIAFISMILLFFVIYFGMQFIEKNLLNDTVPDDNLQQNTYGYIEYNGKTYKPKTRLSTLLLIGIDDYSGDDFVGKQNASLSDFMTLFVFDDAKKSYTMIQINRDTMMEFPVLGVLGDKAGTRYGQIALSYSYGDGLESSSRNTRDAVSELLYDVTIESFITLKMDAVSILNDAVGGVEVEIKDDFSKVDPTLVMGEKIVLKGDQALHFVRARGGVGDQSNLSRMERQKEYMSAFANQFKSAYSNDKNVITNALEDVEGYMITDCTATELADAAECINSYEFKALVSPEGESRVGEKYMEHYVDEDKLKELVLDVFYEEVQTNDKE